MHRAHQPLLPATNRYLQEKWDKATYQEHRRKVELAAPVVNTTTLPTPFHLQVNLKKIQLERERQAARDRDNLQHYAKLWGIKQSQGRVDNWNFYPVHSLNREKRRQDLARICWENQQLMKRLEGRKSKLAQEHWQQDWQKEQRIRNSITRYPHGPASCQARKEGWMQRTGGSSGIPTSASGRSPSTSPGRTRAPCSRKKNSVMGKSFWGSGSESTQEVEASATTSSPFPFRKRDVILPPVALGERPSKGALGVAKIVPGSFSHG